MSSESNSETSVMPAPAVNRGRLLNGNPPGDPSKSPRCGAKSKRTGLPCRAAGIKKAPGVYGRCRVHGGRSTGPKTAEGKKAASHQKHGKYSREAIQRRREMRLKIQRFRLELAALERDLNRMLRARRADQKRSDDAHTSNCPTIVLLHPM
jgi:hypothetical protein